MTERDESSKGFLKRWSRKKIDAEREGHAKAETKDVTPATEARPLERLGRLAHCPLLEGAACPV